MENAINIGYAWSLLRQGMKQLIINLEIPEITALEKIEEKDAIAKAEVNFLGDLVHHNLVRLIGCCIEEDQRLLVHEFMPRGSLENHLFRRIESYSIVFCMDDLLEFKFCYVEVILFYFDIQPSHHRLLLPISIDHRSKGSTDYRSTASPKMKMNKMITRSKQNVCWV